MNLKKYFLFIAASSILVTACKKSGIPGPPTVATSNVDVYIAGVMAASNGNPYAVYWKNGVVTKLGDSSSFSSANAIWVNGSDVYIVGNTSEYGATYRSVESLTAASYLTYWKNGVIFRLSDPLLVTQGGSEFYVQGSDVYVVGSYGNYWKNGAPINFNFNGGPTGLLGNAIFVNGNDVYIAGYAEYFVTSQPDLFNFIASYWKNGNLTKLKDSTSYGNTTYSTAEAIAVKDTNVYAAGYIQDIYNENSATYWKNGVATKLSPASDYSEAHGLFLNGTDVYIAGFAFGTDGIYSTAYWKNGIQTNLKETGLHHYYDNFNNGNASVVVNGNDVYVVSGFAGYWKNGVFVQLAPGCAALGIAVVPK